jgi:Fur family ferric uptake transcriptional regulator
MKQMESTDSQDTSDILSEDAQRDRIIRKLRENGCRITQQRLLLLDIILKNQCSSCKEMYAEAVKNDSHIGIATVYRMVNMLEEIGAINRRNMYKVIFSESNA